MPRFLIPVTVLFVSAFMALNAAAGVLGTTQPLNPALAGFGCTPQPCWNGIVPGVTTLNEAGVILGTFNYAFLGTSDGAHFYSSPENPVCSVKLNGEMEIVSAIDLLICQPVQVGDVLNQLGYPVQVGWGGNLPLLSGYGSIKLLRDRAKSIGCVALTPFGLVRLITLTPFEEPHIVIRTPVWQGFMPYERYARKYYLPFCDDPYFDSS